MRHQNNGIRLSREKGCLSVGNVLDFVAYKKERDRVEEELREMMGSYTYTVSDSYEVDTVTISLALFEDLLLDTKDINIEIEDPS